MKCQLHKNIENYCISRDEDPFEWMPETYIVELKDKMNRKYILDHP